MMMMMMMMKKGSGRGGGTTTTKRNLAITANILNDYFMSGTMLHILHLLSHLIFATTLTI